MQISPFQNKWIIHPIIGDIVKLSTDIFRVTTICEPLIKDVHVIFCVYSDLFYNKMEIIPNLLGPTKLDIDIPGNVYKFRWYQNILITDSLIKIAINDDSNVEKISIIKQGDKELFWIKSPNLLSRDSMYEQMVITKEIPDRIIFHTTRSNYQTSDREQKIRICNIRLSDVDYNNTIYNRCLDIALNKGINLTTQNNIISVFGSSYYNVPCNYNLWNDIGIQGYHQGDLLRGRINNFVKRLCILTYNKYVKILDEEESKPIWSKRLGNILIIIIQIIVPLNEIFEAINTFWSYDIVQIILCFQGIPIINPIPEINIAEFWTSATVIKLYLKLFTLIGQYRCKISILGSSTLSISCVIKYHNKTIPIVVISSTDREPENFRFLKAKISLDKYYYILEDMKIKFDSMKPRHFCIVDI